MSISLIGQGYSPAIGSSAAVELIRLFNDTTFNSFTCVVAFASRDAVSALSTYIEQSRQRGSTIKIVVGIDQGGTSRQALEEIAALNVSSFIFHLDTPGNSVIFHPKIYLFEGNGKYAVLIGSNNLTTNGLARNAECATLVKGNLGDSFHSELYHYWGNLFNLSDSALRPITTEYIEELSTKGIIPNERIRSKRHDSSAHNPRNNPLSNPFESRRPQSLPEGFYPKSRGTVHLPVHTVVVDYSSDTDYEVYITEIPKAGSRWRQVNVPRQVFLDFFGAAEVISADGTRNYTGEVTLTNILQDGSRSAPRTNPLVNVASQNYRIETYCPETQGNYPVDGRPVAIYVKTGDSSFDFVVLLPSSPCYTEVEDYLIKENSALGSVTLHRLYMNFSSLRDISPGLPFFIDR
jgi:HKD family nuclease